MLEESRMSAMSATRSGGGWWWVGAALAGALTAALVLVLLQGESPSPPPTTQGAELEAVRREAAAALPAQTVEATAPPPTLSIVEQLTTPLCVWSEVVDPRSRNTEPASPCDGGPAAPAEPEDDRIAAARRGVQATFFWVAGAASSYPDGDHGRVRHADQDLPYGGETGGGGSGRGTAS